MRVLHCVIDRPVPTTRSGRARRCGWILTGTFATLVSLSAACSTASPELTATSGPPGAHEIAAGPGLVDPPLYFEANQGQTDPRVKFVAQGQGYRLFLTATEAVLAFRPGQGGGGRDQSTVRLGLIGARRDVGVEGLDLLQGRINYFIGNDPTRWRTDVPTFARVRYRDVYPGVDLVYHGGRGPLEFDLVLAPGADPKSIRLRIAGADGLRLEPHGDLLALAGGREIRLRMFFVDPETT